jgi:hypothetical protein
MDDGRSSIIRQMHRGEEQPPTNLLLCKYAPPPATSLSILNMTGRGNITLRGVGLCL